MIKQPTFLVIGSYKSGTSALNRFLSQHSQIYMSPVKEPKFFALQGKQPDFRGPGDDKTINRNSVTHIDDYFNLFEDAEDFMAVGEISNIYLYSEDAPANIKHLLPEVRLVAILRNPVDRAFSSYLHLVREGYETESFSAALSLEDKRIKANWRPLWHYVRAGFYGEQLTRFREYFDESQFRVYLYEDFCSQPVAVLQDIFAFVGVDSGFVPDTTGRYNAYRSYGNKYLDWLLLQPNMLRKSLRSVIPASIRRQIHALAGKPANVRPVLEEELRRHLSSVYRADISRLQELIGRDLTHWLS